VTQFIIAGFALGSVYALAATGVVLTYVSSGVLNFAFASLAFFVARFYYWLNTQHGWPILPSALLSLLVLSPLMGAFLWAVLFRFLRLSSPLIKIVSTVGLAVAIPPIASLLFGNATVLTVPGLAPQPVHVYSVGGVAVSLDQVIIYACLVGVSVIGVVVLRFTSAGIVVRAAVDSEAMAGISAIPVNRVAVSVWVVSTTLAGLAGVLAAPIIGLTVETFTVLVAASFASVIVARFRSLGLALATGLAMGIITSIVERYVSSTSPFSTAIVPSIPFGFIFLALLYMGIRRHGRVEEGAAGGALDRAIAVQVAGASARAVRSASEVPRVMSGWLPPTIAIAVVAILPLVLHQFWVGLVGAGLAYGIVFMSYTLVTGEGGMIWLCQITFAGIGAIMTAYMATTEHWPFFAALLVGGIVASAFGAFIGLLTVGLGNLYIALVTLTFGLLIENLVFSIPTFYNFGQGIALSPPSFAGSARVFSWMVLVIFVMLALLVANFRRSTAGLALNGVRWNESAAKTLGVNVILMRLMVGVFAAFVAGIGGGLLASYVGTASTLSYATFGGLTWLAVIVTVGVRSNVAAAVAGLLFSFLPAIFLNYLPLSVAAVPPALFGLGAILVARNPDGTIVMHTRQIEALLARKRRGQGGTGKGVAMALAASAPGNESLLTDVTISAGAESASPEAGDRPSSPTAVEP
jgi:branched-chain amino acid transport system permease protein